MRTRAGFSASWLWLAVAAGFSPALVELAVKTAEPPRSVTVVVAAALLIAAAWREHTEDEPHRGSGIALLALASALEIVGILGGASTFARISVPLAVIGTARLLGRPTLPVALLSFWLVPIPVFLLEPVRAPLEHAAASAVAAALQLFSGAGTAVGPLVRAHGETLELQSPDAGLHLAHLLALLGWYGSVILGASIGSAARTAMIAAFLAVPLQPVFLGLAAFAFHVSGSTAARALLDLGLPALVIVAFLAWAEQRRRRAFPSAPH